MGEQSPADHAASKDGIDSVGDIAEPEGMHKVLETFKLPFPCQSPPDTNLFIERQLNGIDPQQIHVAQYEGEHGRGYGR